MIFPQIAAEALSKICIELENNRVCSIARYVLFKYVQRWICTFWGFLVSCYRYFNRLSSSCFLTFLLFKFCRKQQKKNSLWMICRVLITMLKVPWFVVLFIYIFFGFIYSYLLFTGFVVNQWFFDLCILHPWCIKIPKDAK